MTGQIIKGSLLEAQQGLQELITNEPLLKTIAMAGEKLACALQTGARIYSCGNGGSMCDAMHFAEELSGRYRKDRRPLAAMSISDPSHLTCTSNDYGYEYVFSRFLEAHARPGDALLAISTSGESKSVLNAAIMARNNGVAVIGLHGRLECALAELSDYSICTPVGTFADRVQELHIKVIHILIEIIERRLFPQNY